MTNPANSKETTMLPKGWTKSYCKTAVQIQIAQGIDIATYFAASGLSAAQIAEVYRRANS